MEKKDKKISTLGSRATSLVSVCLVLVLVGVVCMAAVAGRSLREEVRGNVGFTVVMERESLPTVIDAMKRRMLASEGIESFRFTSAEDILATESEQLGDDIASMIEANPYSSEFEAKVTADYANADSVTALADRFAAADGVAEVICESEVLAGLDAAIGRAGIVLGALALVLLIVSIALINNTVSLSIYGRRFTIHTMKLVGATGAYIRRPFVRAALAGGLCAGVVAAALIALLRWYVESSWPDIASLLPWPAVAAICCGLVVAGALLCGLTAAFAANRYLRSNYDRMFLS